MPSLCAIQFGPHLSKADPSQTKASPRQTAIDRQSIKTTHRELDLPALSASSAPPDRMRSGHSRHRLQTQESVSTRIDAPGIASSGWLLVYLRNSLLRLCFRTNQRGMYASPGATGTRQQVVPRSSWFIADFPQPISCSSSGGRPEILHVRSSIDTSTDLRTTVAAKYSQRPDTTISLSLTSLKIKLWWILPVLTADEQQVHAVVARHFDAQ